ncbi:MAG: hypothetical protein DI630_20690 [Gordonia sp. (in: high G+C Gram-positive bacteria)]|nr:MAG: hypothetical protein DI630_20690 [Gordonia sp. (in: high G+C Gram-positive bacteria)]
MGERVGGSDCLHVGCGPQADTAPIVLAVLKLGTAAGCLVTARSNLTPTDLMTTPMSDAPAPVRG